MKMLVAGDSAAATMLLAVLDAADAALIVVLDEALQIRHVSAGVMSLLGWAPEQVDGQPYSVLLTSEDENGARPSPVLTGPAHLRTRGGSLRAVCLTSSLVHDDAGTAIGTVVVAVEATARSEHHNRSSQDDSGTPDVPDSAVKRRLADSEEQFRLTFDRSPTAMAIVSLSPATLGRVRRLNAAFETFTGRRRRELFSMSLHQLLHPEEVPGHLAYLHLAAESGECEPDGIERRFLHADGHIRWARKTTAVVTPSSSSEPYLLVQLHDITDQRAAVEALAHAALHDPLTGLANRALFTDRLQLALTADRRSRIGVSLLYLDLDAFKPINDRYGHAAGDAVLVEVAHRLREAMRGEDTVARLGGDEFAIICPGLDVEHLPVVVTRLQGALSAPFRVPLELTGGPGDGSMARESEDRPVHVGVSIGTATSTHHVGGGAPGVLVAPRAEQMLAAADQAMYTTKRGGLSVPPR